MSPLRLAIHSVQKEMRINGDSKELIEALDILCEIELKKTGVYVH